MTRALAALLLMATTAASQPACGPRDAIAKMLLDRHGERLVVGGLSASGAWIEWYMSPSGGWTLVQVRPDMLACIVQVGNGGMQMPSGEMM